MKIAIDREACIQCGNCASVCPEVFELKPGQKSAVKQKYRTGEPGEGETGGNLDKCVSDAVDGCPVQAITAEK
jgi:ferredoxin